MVAIQIYFAVGKAYHTFLPAAHQHLRRTVGAVQVWQLASNRKFFSMSCRLQPLFFLPKAGTIRSMKRDQVIHVLSKRRGELASQYGVKSLALFGSMARDQATAASDVDLLVEFDRPVGYFGLFALQDHLESLLGCKVDLGTPASLKPRIRERVMRECVRVT
jgi:predicted nucleotidyltransferase